MSVRFIFPNHPYVGYNLRDVDWIAEHLAKGWYIYSMQSWLDGIVVNDYIKIYNEKGDLWHCFNDPDEQWLILTDDGVPFDFFETQLDMEVAAQELANFRTGMLTLTHALSKIQSV